MGRVAKRGRSVPYPAKRPTKLRTFEAKGLTEEDALVQARCAFILRHGHYDDGRVNHWNP